MDYMVIILKLLKGNFLSKSTSILELLGCSYLKKNLNSKLMKYFIVKFFICLHSAAFFLSCTKDRINTHIDNNPTDTITTEEFVLWQIPLEEDSAEYTSINPYLINDGVLFSRQSIIHTQNEKIKFVNKHNGDLIWEWEDYIRPAPGQSAIRPIIIDNVIIVNSSQDNYAVNANSGETIWAINEYGGNPWISSFENLVFHTYSYGSSPKSDSTALFYCEAEKGNWKEILRFQKTDNFEINCKPPGAYINEEQDTIIIFKNTSIVIGSSDSKVDLYCYNLTQKTMLWEKLDFDPIGEANIKPPLIDGDYVYHVGFKEIFCINKYTGETIWQWGFPDLPFGFFYDFLIHEDKFILPRSNGDLFALDKETGHEIWSIKNNEAGFAPRKMAVYNDRLYYGSSKLYIINTDTGVVEHAIQSPNRSSRFPMPSF
jgi:outer membrane protein assembly factor BamB